MPLKKHSFTGDEINIFDEAVVYKRGEYWQMRMWLEKERKYARFSLRTRNRDTAEAKAKKHYHELMAQQLSGKKYFSKTAKEGVLEYLQQRAKDVEADLIVKGRYGTIKIHLEHWLAFIGRDTKLKELESTDCENYLHSRTKTKKNITVSQTTVANEQTTINAMMKWLYKRNETYIDCFDFKPMKRIDKGDEALRRGMFTEEEVVVLIREIEKYISGAKKAIQEEDNLTKVIVGYFFLLSIITGLRRGEQRQLCWSDIEWMEKNVKGRSSDETYSLVKINVRAAISKVRKTRRFVVKDLDYFDDLFKILYPRYVEANRGKENAKHFSAGLIFSTDGVTKITERAIYYHLGKIIELAEIKDIANRNLTLNSFRHTFITDKINKGYNPTQVAEMCGTSTKEIEDTYYHTSEAKMITNAVPGFDYRNGMLIKK